MSLQSAWAFSLLGPEGNGGNGTEDAWQVNEIGYNPLIWDRAPPFFTDNGPLTGPKNLGEGYRLNTPVLYYTFDSSFGSYFGSDGEAAVQQAFDMLNSLTNVDSYSTNLTEFPLNSESQNYTARALGLRDLKSTTLTLLLEQMGLADVVRYVWALIDRYAPTGANCPVGGPSVGYYYYVVERNFNYFSTPLNQLQYSPYVNNELYSYFIYDDCDRSEASPPTADAIEISVDPLNNNPPVASGNGEDALPLGSFYTRLTRDDVAGLRYLLSSNNIFAPGAGYLESPAGGSVAVSGGSSSTYTNYNDEFTLTTSNLTVLVMASATNNPAALQVLYPGLAISSVISNIYSGTFIYTFANVVTNHGFTNTPVQYQIITTTIAPPVTTITTNFINTNLNIASGDFFLLPTNLCGLDVLAILATNVTAVTNFLGIATNANAPNTTNYSGEYTLTTSNLAALNLAALTNNPTVLHALYPGLVISSVITNYDGTFTYTFANVVVMTNSFSTNTTVQYQIQTTTIAPCIGQPWDSPPCTNIATSFINSNLNVASGGFFLVPTNLCGLDVLSIQATNVTAVTNILGTVTTTNSSTIIITSTNTVIVSTNYTLLVAPCEFTTIITSTNRVIVSTNYTLYVAPCEFLNGATTTTTNGDFQGIGRVQFVRVADGNYDYQTHQFYNPITNQYSMVLMQNGQASTVTFQRVVRRPDILFMGQDLSVGGSGTRFLYNTLARSIPDFIDSRAADGLAGPGIIDPTSGTNATIIYNTVGPVFFNTSPAFLNGPDSYTGDYGIWGSFDGTTNAPIVYPNGTSIANLAAEALIQISPPPPTLPDGTNTMPYSITLSATGGQSPYTWSLTANSAGLPPGLTLSSGGVISGTPTNSATYDDIVIQMTDTPLTNKPSYTIDMTYSITIH